MHPGELCRFTLDPGISGAEGVAEHRGSEAFASQHAEQAGALPAKAWRKAMADVQDHHYGITVIIN